MNLPCHVLSSLCLSDLLFPGVHDTVACGYPPIEIPTLLFSFNSFVFVFFIIKRCFIFALLHFLGFPSLFYSVYFLSKTTRPRLSSSSYHIIAPMIIGCNPSLSVRTCWCCPASSTTVQCTNIAVSVSTSITSLSIFCPSVSASCLVLRMRGCVSF